MKKPKGARLEVLRSEHFNTEIRFDKSRGIFSVEMPVGEEPIVGTELEKVRSAAKVKLKEREAALIEIQKGLGKLTERLRELVATPELIGRAMRELSSGGKR